MGKPVAVKGCTLQISPSSIQGTLRITSTPSTKVLIDNNGVYFNEIKVMLMSGATSGGATLPAPVTFTIRGTGSNMVDNNKKAVLEGDTSSTIQCNFQMPNGTPVPIPATVKVQKAGQTSTVHS